MNNQKKTLDKLTLTIGIPVYNEEKNIVQLLESLLRQKQENFILSEIIVISDGSADDTVKSIEKVKNKKIKLIVGRERLGKSYRVKEMFSRFKTDTFCIIDADILIKDNNLYDKIFSSINLSECGLIGIKNVALHHGNLLQSTLALGVDLKNDIIANWNNGNNYLSFKGNFLILHRELIYKIKNIKGLVNDDAYIYFTAIKNGYRPKYLNNIKIYFEVPFNFRDHIGQSSRFQSSYTELKNYFDFDLNNYYKIPIHVLVGSFIKTGLVKPIYLLSYISVLLISKIKRKTNLTGKWEIAQSTKNLL